MTQTVMMHTELVQMQKEKLVHNDLQVKQKAAEGPAPTKNFL